MIEVVLVGDYNTPHIVVRVGNNQTRLHSETYANRSNGRRAWRTLADKFDDVVYGGVVRADETVKPSK